jgi:putative spermidine/putrescine transport system substrate-binding protein
MTTKKEIKEKKSEIKSDRVISRRNFLRWTATAALGALGASIAQSIQFAPKGYATEPEIFYQGEIFDAKGAVLRLSDWGGFWEEAQRKNLVNQFEKDFNCKVEYDSSWPWFPKYVAGGAANPPFDVSNWNLPEMNKTAMVVDPFLPLDQLRANVPKSEELWDFAFANGIGITYLFSQYGYVYRTDMLNGDPPTKFSDFWQPRFAGRRSTYITTNTLFMVHFMVSADVFGESPTDLEAGIQAYRDAMPMKISDFTGHMQLLIERGEVVIAVQHDGEGLLQKAKGLPVDWFNWGVGADTDTKLQPILTQTKTISKNIPLIQKKLAAALINRSCEASYQEASAEAVLIRPTNKNAKIHPTLAALGVKNTAEAVKGLWIPPWREFWIPNEKEIVRRVNDIYAGGKGEK